MLQVQVTLDTAAMFMLSRFIRLRSSTQSFVDALLPQDRAQIGTFGEEIAINPHLTNDKQVLRRVLRDELWPMGGTPIWNALDAAMTSLASESGRRVVLAITDGVNVCYFRRCLKPGDVERRAVREGFMLYAVGMDGTGLDREIIEMAADTGGGHFELPVGADLSATFTRVADELRRQYVLGFSPSELDGKLHRVEIRMAKPGMRSGNVVNRRIGFVNREVSDAARHRRGTDRPEMKRIEGRFTRRRARLLGLLGEWSSREQDRGGQHHSDQPIDLHCQAASSERGAAIIATDYTDHTAGAIRPMATDYTRYTVDRGDP